MGHTGNASTGSAAGELSEFAYRGLDLLREIEYRPMTSPEDLHRLYRFRYDCYRRDGHIDENRERLSYDEYDDDPQVMRFGLFMKDRLVSSVRLQRLTKERRIGPSMRAFSDVLAPMLDGGVSMIDPSRFTIDEDLTRDYPLLPYLTIRLAVQAMAHFGTEYCLSLIRPTHSAFYRRVFQARRIGEERTWPGVNFPVVLYASEASFTRERMFRRYPFFHALPHERRMLFGENEAVGTRSLTVLPTADLAIAA